MDVEAQIVPSGPCSPQPALLASGGVFPLTLRAGEHNPPRQACFLQLLRHSEGQPCSGFHAVLPPARPAWERPTQTAGTRLRPLLAAPGFGVRAFPHGRRGGLGFPAPASVGCPLTGRTPVPFGQREEGRTPMLDSAQEPPQVSWAPGLFFSLHLSPSPSGPCSGDAQKPVE